VGGVTDRLKIVVSDLHIGTGHSPGQVNPYEDFSLDDRLAEMLSYYTTGMYEGRETELIINGDFFDLLKVPLEGAFPEEITESISMNKVKLCIDGHPVVMDALREFVAPQGRRITYIPGNHDMDFMYTGVRHLFCAALTGSTQDPRIKFITGSDRYELPEGIQIMHGHQYEPIHSFNFEELFLTHNLERPILNLPWGSFFVIKVIAPLRPERPYLDAVRPFIPYVMLGLITDFRFAFKFLFRSVYFFIKTRLFKVMNRKTYFRKLWKIFRENLIFSSDLEQFAERLLATSFGTRIVIMGHTHRPMVRSYGQDKLYINSGTWTRMINLTIGSIGISVKPTYVLIEYEKGVPNARLLEWKGAHRPFEQLDI
jgi:UDP-2,3-diacylglucosamine pyrophosphatase LpxH